jgi:capsular exopolysaccharide synthesis family protein
MDSGQTNQSLEQVLGVLRRSVPVVVFCVLLAGGVSYLYSNHLKKKYTATAALVFSENQLGQQVAGLPSASSTNQQAQQSTNVKLVQLGDTAAKTARLLKLTKEQVTAALNISALGESNIVTIAATVGSAKLARDTANTYAAQFVTAQQNADHAYYASALRLVDRQLARLSKKERNSNAGIALQSRAQSLGVLAELRNGSVRQAQRASLPTSPSSPDVAKNTAFGAVIGLLLGLGVALLIARLDRRVRDPEDFKAIYGVPLLGVVPDSSVLSRAGKQRSPLTRRRRRSRGLPPREEEAFQLIRAHLRYFNIDRELRTLLVVSAGPGDGKTTVARHLASAAARMGSVVLLLEADLREPALAGQLDLQPGPGLADVLIGEVSLWSATQLVDVDSAPIDGSAGRSLDVLAAGVPLPPNPAKLIESQAMEGVLEEARATYDLVVIDTPPLAAVSDAFPLLRKVDGVIIVGRAGRNRRDVAQRLGETLAGAHAPLLGVVANGFKVGRVRSYDHAYGPVPGGGPRVVGEPGAVTAASDNGLAAADTARPAHNPGRPDTAIPGHDRPAGYSATRR